MGAFSFRPPQWCYKKGFARLVDSWRSWNQLTLRMSFIRGTRLTIMRPWADLEVGIMSILRMPGIIVWKSRRESPYVKHGCRWGEPRVQHRGTGVQKEPLCTAWRWAGKILQRNFPPRRLSDSYRLTGDGGKLPVTRFSVSQTIWQGARCW